MEEPQLVTPETTQTSAFAVYTRLFLKWTCLMSRLMQIQILSLSLKTSHFNTLFSNFFSSFTKKWTLMSNVLYFISEIPYLYMFVWEGGSSWHNHLPKCAKVHFSEFQILKFSRWKPPYPPYGRGTSPSHTLPPTARAACGRRWSALLHYSDGYSISFSYLKIWGEPCNSASC